MRVRAEVTQLPEPKLEAPGHADSERPSAEALLTVKDLVVEYAVHSPTGRTTGATVRAVDGVSFEIGRGETLALVGESGCGKTTTGQALLGLRPILSGSVRYQGNELTSTSHRQLRRLRRRMQIVFQDPYSSLNPRLKVRDVVAEPLRIHRIGDRREQSRRVDECLEMVGLHTADGSQYPHEFSGGQRQRIGIARALALRPDFLVLDEPLSALDVSTQAEIVNLLLDLQSELALSYLFIAHDLAVVSAMCDRVAVMYLGRVVECGERSAVFRRPTHPYTQALLSAVPRGLSAGPTMVSRVRLTGEVPSPDSIPSGCRFRGRCWRAADICEIEDPPLSDRKNHGHVSACHFPG